MPIPTKTCFCGEVGLSGEIRPVSRVEQSIAEAARMGFAQILVSDYNLKGINTGKFGIRVIPVKKIEEAIKVLYG
jgi:DNA repair protein RadA/Sms